jgi:hypothetical protein
MATEIRSVAVNKNGEWSTVIQRDTSHVVSVYSSDRPHNYYMAAFDCNQNFPREYSANPKNTPKVLVEWTLLNDNDNHFSYEDMGSLKLSCFILVIQILLGVMTARSYIIAIRTHERYLSPHPIMLMSLFTQIAAQFM